MWPQAGTCVCVCLCVPRASRDLLKHRTGSPPCPCPVLTAPAARLLVVWGSFCGAAAALRSLLPAPSRHAPRGEAPASLALGAGPVPPGRPRCSEGALLWMRPYWGAVLGAAGLAWCNCGADPHPCPIGTGTAPLCHPPRGIGLSTPGSISGGCHTLGKAKRHPAPLQQAAAGPRGGAGAPGPAPRHMAPSPAPAPQGRAVGQGGAGRFPPAAPACRGPTSLPPAAKRPPLPELPPRAPSACCARRRGPRIPRLFLGWPYQPSCPRAAARLSHHPVPCSSHREPRCRPRGKVGTLTRPGGPRGGRVGATHLVGRGPPWRLRAASGGDPVAGAVRHGGEGTGGRGFGGLSGQVCAQTPVPGWVRGGLGAGDGGNRVL